MTHGGGVNILSKCQLPSSYGLGFMMLSIFEKNMKSTTLEQTIKKLLCPFRDSGHKYGIEFKQESSSPRVTGLLPVVKKQLKKSCI